MYSESDIDSAVQAGALSSEAAQALRNHVATLRAAPAVDEESFRLLTGFNDIFVAIAIGLVLVAVGWIGSQFGGGSLSGAAIAAVSWGLAEYFTRHRRMALPSIVLLLTFSGGVLSALLGVALAVAQHLPEDGRLLPVAGVALLTAGAVWLHWRRFRVPITVAVGAVVLVGGVVSLILPRLDGFNHAAYLLLLAGGVVVFASAIRWDTSDRERRTYRSDVAFWLHLAAAPLITHPLFHLIGVFGGSVGPGQAFAVLALYLVFGVIALVLDRRALLVSSLAYVLYALWTLFKHAGLVELSWALTALVIGLALLSLSVFWLPLRRRLVAMLGPLGARLPPVRV